MALIAGLLLAALMSTALGALVVAAGVERRAAAAQETRAHLRLAAEGALLLMARDLESAGYPRALEGFGSPAWRRPLSPVLDINALTTAVRHQTVMGSRHGTDTPVWQVYAHAGWNELGGGPSRVRFVGWVADDWDEQDGDPGTDSNGRLLLRVRALAEPAGAWAEALCAKEAGGRVSLRHRRTW